MKKQFKEISGSIVAPIGFMASGVFCDIKKLGTGKGSNKGQKRDLALIVSETPATVAGNQVCAAPVKVCVERMKKGTAQVVVVNSGNANACTGKQGMADAREMVAFTEKTLALSAGRALVGSTGRIGVTMPMDNIRAGIMEAAMELGATAAHADNAVEAIMTSDTKPKQVAVEFKLGGKTVRIGGICKGAGMIQPGMSATGGVAARRIARDDARLHHDRCGGGAKSFAGGVAGSGGAKFQPHHRGRRHEHERHGLGARKWLGRQPETRRSSPVTRHFSVCFKSRLS